MPTNYESVIDWTTELSSVSENILPVRLKSLMNEVSQSVHLYDLYQLEELSNSASRLSDLYYDEYISGSLQYCVYYISNRVATDIRRIINMRQTAEPENPTTEETIQDETGETGGDIIEIANSEDYTIDGFPQTRYGMERFITYMYDTARLWNYSNIISDDVYVRLPKFLKNALVDFQNICDQTVTIGMTVDEIRANRELYSKIDNLYNQIKEYLYNGTECYSHSFIADFLLTRVARLTGRDDLFY